MCSVQFSHSVVSDSLWPHESLHARPPCLSPTFGVYSNSCPSSRWCHPAISSPVVPFSSCPQSLPASGPFPVSQLFTWGGQSTGDSALASILPMNTQDWCLLGWNGWISLQSKGLSSLLQHHSSKASIFWCSAFFTVQLSHPYMTVSIKIFLQQACIFPSFFSPSFKEPIKNKNTYFKSRKNFFLLTVVSNCNFFNFYFLIFKNYTTFFDMYTLLYLFILGCVGSLFLHVEEEMATHSSILAWKTL